MINTTARMKKSGKNFEIIVNLDDAVKFKKGEISQLEAEGEKIFSDVKKGMVASRTELEECFGTTDVDEISERIIREGEILLTQEYRDAERDKRIKQVVDFLSKNAVNPQTGNPHSVERIKSALEQSHINIKNVPMENQIKDIITEIGKIIPIKIGTKKVRISVPAVHTGKAYGLLNQYKEEEKWLNDGSLNITVSVPSGMIMDFYDKLNSMTHGSAITEEVRE